MASGGLFGYGSEFRFSLIDLGMMFIPPSAAYAKMGMARDFYSALSGSFSIPSMQSWLMAYARGKGGFSKKVWRRRIRRKLWE